MIEFMDKTCYEYPQDIYNTLYHVDEWTPLPVTDEVDSLWFEFQVIKINDEVHTKDSERFQKLLEAARVWEKLSD